MDYVSYCYFIFNFIYFFLKPKLRLVTISSIFNILPSITSLGNDIWCSLKLLEQFRDFPVTDIYMNEEEITKCQSKILNWFCLNLLKSKV